MFQSRSRLLRPSSAITMVIRHFLIHLALEIGAELLFVLCHGHSDFCLMINIIAAIIRAMIYTALWSLTRK